MKDKFIVEIHDGISPEQAFYYAMKVASVGRISKSGGIDQHCFITVFESGAKVCCVQNEKSERFIISKD